ncbi:MAG: hypothetical protein D3909_11825 [Candidatus Electrothrix sp. ATG1]|nr:hypothetical protein [Candidatus Electrothrix sp. ATG1]
MDIIRGLMFFSHRNLHVSRAAFLLFCTVFNLFPSRGISKIRPLSQDLLDAGELVTKSEAVLRGFLEDPNMKWFQENISTAHGVFIAPEMLRGDFLIGNSDGPGVLLVRDPATGKWSYPGFYSIDSVSMGFQIGADASEIILLIMTEQGMRALLSPEFKIDAKVVVASGPVGDGPPHYSADILAYARSMMGIIGGVALAGSVITPRTSLNHAYYGQPVSLVDIFLRQTVSNSKAESLRKRVATASEEPDKSL